jgi:hypothetical protein
MHVMSSRANDDADTSVNGSEDAVHESDAAPLGVPGTLTKTLATSAKLTAATNILLIASSMGGDPVPSG